METPFWNFTDPVGSDQHRQFQLSIIKNTVRLVVNNIESGKFYQASKSLCKQVTTLCKQEYKRGNAVNKAERVWHIFIPQVNNLLSVGGRNKPCRWNIIKISGF